MTRLKEEIVPGVNVMVENGKSIRNIASELGVDESTLRYRLNRYRTESTDGRTNKEEACEPYHEVIMSWIEEQKEKERPESVKALYEGLVLEHGFTGSYKSVLRYVRRRSVPPAIRPIRRVETEPGTQSQVDWLTTRVYVEQLGGTVKLNAFLMALSYCRMWSVIWSVRMDMLSWISCHNQAFSFLGGITKTIRIDNLRTGVAKGSGTWGTLNAGYRSYAKETGFVINPSRRKSPRDKGKVERRVRDVKYIQITERDRFDSVEELQAVIDERLLDRSLKLTSPVTGRSVYESWYEELPTLRPLPLSLPQPFDVQVTRPVTKDCLVSFENRQYSVPFIYTGREVTVRGCQGTVQIYSDLKKIAQYPRHTECRLLIDQSHYEGKGTREIIAPTPLGRIGKEIVRDRSWEAPSRSITQYEKVAGILS
jgi:transposase